MSKEKIISLEAENFKNIKAITVNFEDFNVIGGANKAGKTSILDAICFALGGGKYKPSKPQREGSVGATSIKLTTSSGLIVERGGKNLTLKITDPTGAKQGQSLLTSLIDDFALNLPKFLNSNNTEKAKLFLDRNGLGKTLDELDKEAKAVYDSRHALGVLADTKKKHFEELPSYEGVPNEIVTANELISQQEAILLKNAQNNEARGKVKVLIDNIEKGKTQLKDAKEREQYLIKQLEETQLQTKDLESKLVIANDFLIQSKKTASELKDENLDEIKSKLEEIDVLNGKVRANLDKSKAKEEYQNYQAQKESKNEELKAIKQKQTEALNAIEFPLEGLSIEDKELTYNGNKWDCLSGAEQIKIGTAIVKQLNPNQGFVLVDKLEQMDEVSLKEYCQVCKDLDLQVIGTKVSTGDECSIIIEEGEIVKANDYYNAEASQAVAPPKEAEYKLQEFDPKAGF